MLNAPLRWAIHWLSLPKAQPPPFPLPPDITSCVWIIQACLQWAALTTLKRTTTTAWKMWCKYEYESINTTTLQMNTQNANHSHVVTNCIRPSKSTLMRRTLCRRRNCMGLLVMTAVMGAVMPGIIMLTIHHFIQHHPFLESSRIVKKHHIDPIHPKHHRPGGSDCITQSMRIFQWTIDFFFKWRIHNISHTEWDDLGWWNHVALRSRNRAKKNKNHYFIFLFNQATKPTMSRLHRRTDV